MEYDLIVEQDKGNILGKSVHREKLSRKAMNSEIIQGSRSSQQENFQDFAISKITNHRFGSI